MNNFLWGVFPYICIVLFFAVPIVRMVFRPYSWSTRASGLFGRRLLGGASTLFHWGLVLVLTGHLFGLFGGLIGSEHSVVVFYWLGLVGGFMVLVGSILMLWRRMTNAEVAAMSQFEDYAIHFFLIAIVGIALFQVIAHKIFGITYTASAWSASLWTLHPQPELMESASLLTKWHVFLALCFFGYFPFTKLVHFWTFPVNYFARPYQSMRTQKYRFQRRWEFAFKSDKSWLFYMLCLVAAGWIVAAAMLGQPRMAGSDSPTMALVDKNSGMIATDSGTWLMGYPLYISQCARCHGNDGKGDGPGMHSPTFAALPRDLVHRGEHKGARYHFVSTDNGIASDDDLFRTIAYGLEGSGMPGFPDLTNEQILSLVDVLNEFRADGPEPGTALAVGEAPDSSPAMLAKGAELWAANCVECHGADGSGGTKQIISWRQTGPESWEEIKPARLDRGDIKLGSSPKDLYTRITLGVPGAYGDSNLMFAFPQLTEDERWALVHHVREKILPKSVTSAE